MQTNSSNLGVSKHRKSGKSPKSPKARMAIELRLRKEEKENKSKKREVNCKYSSVEELFSSRR